MDEKMTPKLDLAAELKDVPAPSLTLEPLAPEPAKQPEAVQPAGLDESSLTPEEAKTVAEFAQKIDITDSAVVLQYGAASQKKVADFSGSALEQVRTKDLGEVGGMITDLIGQLKGFDATAEKPKGIMGLFKKAESQIEELKSKYSKAETNVNRIEAMLEGHQVQLMKDMSMLDKMYDMNLVYFKELSMYILAGKKKLDQVRANELPALTARARASGLPEDAQAANDLENMCIRFEKKLHDLELTRNISIQMAPQIRLVQNNDAMMAEKIQSSIVNTIPLWKSQMVLALGMANSQQAMEAQRAVTDMTNELLRKNAETQIGRASCRERVSASV